MRLRIGEFLLHKGLINGKQLEEILAYSKHKKIKFGQAAIELGFLDPQDLFDLFGKGFKTDYYHLDPTAFPNATKDWLSLDSMLREGVVPLGLTQKRKWFRYQTYIKLGFLDPPSRRSQRQLLKEILAAKPKTVRGVFPLLVLVKPFLVILQENYGVSESQLRSMEPQKLHPILEWYFQSTEVL